MADAVEVTVGIDIGTTSVKAVAVDTHGRVPRRVRLTHPVVAPTPSVFEHDAATVWRDRVVAACDAVSDGFSVVGIGLAAMVPSLAAVDGDGVPITAGILYGDQRGHHPDGEFVGFLRWLEQAEPHAAGYWPAQAVAGAALCGEAAIDGVTALCCLPVFDSGGWDARWCDPAKLPRPALDHTPVGHRSGAPVAAGTVDAMAEQIVAGADEPGDVLVICGTTLITWAVGEGWPAAEGLWTIPHLRPGLAAVGGPSNAGGLFLERVRALTGDPAAEPAHPERVPLWVPYIRGERTPRHDPDLRAALVGLHVGHGPEEVLAAAYEASGFVVRHHLDVAGVSPQRLVAVGGGVHVHRWMQALADTVNVPVDVAAVPEGAARGAAWLARVSAGRESTDLADAGRWALVGRRVEPRPEWSDACDRRYPQWRAACDAAAEPVQSKEER
ncbi:xylulokinase [Candidatus Poriferisocius sp.]|uniref:xylulokinase n=1 Tax=Candidatus Poriferisocius sp. TaxID=3101276 RepID=UPI003B5B72A8